MPPKIILLATLFLLVITLPFVYAAGAAGTQAVFGGFLLNPQDGNSYLAKMYQGWQGEWRFHLPFTAEPGPGVYLFVFYIFLGHVARWTGLPLIAVFHLARLVGSACLLAALWRLICAAVPERWRAWTYALALFGLGLGWLALPFGRILSDFWIAEAYPFLSGFSNPHFGFSLALLAALVTLPDSPPGRSWRVFLLALAAGLILSLLSPFGLVMAALALGGGLLLEWFFPAQEHSGAFTGFRSRLAAWQRAPRTRPALLRLVAAVVGGLPFSLYNVLVARAHPQLAAWNAQNLTWTPAAWDVLLSLMPALLLALPGAGWVLRRRVAAAYPLLAWALFAFVLIYLPIDLQRRFMIGLYAPLAALAGCGLAALAERQPGRSRRFAVAGLALALPGALILLLMVTGGLRVKTPDGGTTLNPALFISADEALALSWLASNAAPDALALASPEMGLLIPAHTGQRVIYGHPYETVHAEAEKRAVEDFFSGRSPDPQAFLLGRGVDYILAGPRERAIGSLPAGLPLEAVFSSGAVTLYRFVPAP